MTPGFPHGQHHERETRCCSRAGSALGTAAALIHPQFQLQIPAFPPFPPAEEPSESNKMIYFIPSSGKAQFCPEKVKNLWSWQEQQVQVLWGGKSQELGELNQFLWSGQGFELLGVSPSFSNILDDLLKLLFCVHVEFHPRLHRGKLQEKEQGVKCG